MFSKRPEFILLGFLLLTLNACGGGSSDGGSQSIDPPVTPTPPSPPAQPTTDHSGLTPLSAEAPEPGESQSGGAATVQRDDEDAFSFRPDAVAQDFRLDANFTQGNFIFRSAHEDFGPLLNTSSCQGCHLNDGRGVLPNSPDDPFTSTLVKIGVTSGAPDPVYGDQIQTFSEQSFSTSDVTSGLPVFDGSLNGDELFGEAFTSIEFEAVNGTYADGTTYELRRPIYRFRDLSFGPFADDIQFSTRVSPQVFGSGLLEAIPQENIMNLVDEEDANGDGISGRPSIVEDFTTGETLLGRFSYKAQSASVLQQTIAAYRGDIGITSRFLPEENCTDAQIACQNAALRENQVGDDVDITDRELALVEFYTRTLAVPVRRGFDTNTNTFEENIVQGRRLFFESGCVGCHTPRHVTGELAGSTLGEVTITGLDPEAEPIEVLSNQTIYPYTDLLVHDMGGSCSITRETDAGLSCEAGSECLYVQRCEGLADDLIQGDVSGSEWKTPALWGLGLVQVVNANATFLHDGRARTIEEAVLWHGGEAQNARDQFTRLDSQDRQLLLAFLESL
jgi:CxxC motif-containing protein (DUF1111 family)